MEHIDVVHACCLQPRRRFVDSVYNFILSGPGETLWLRANSTGSHPEVIACTLGKHVPTFPEPFWGTDEVVNYMRSRDDWPNIVQVVR